LPYIHKCHQILIALPRPLARGERAVIRVDATEDTIIQLTPHSYWIYSDSAWFPRIGDKGGRYTIDWTVKVAKPMTAAGSGDLVREWTEDKMNCAEWRSDFPVMIPSFIFGDFDRVEDVYKRAPPATGEVKLRLYAIAGGAVAVRGKTENIFFNIKQGLEHYEAIFGPFPFGELDITQMAEGVPFSQSPPGVLFISGEALKGGGGGGRIDQHIFHELAHQWWGTKVGWVGPENDWISESMAEYASGLLTEGIDPSRFRQQLKEWRQGAEEADDKASIADAYESDMPGMRNRLIYDKGPCVVHMLRTWMGWEKFTRLTSTLQEKYKGRSINTDTFAREASRIMGYDMFPFFDQWIRDQGIPRVHDSWTTSPTPDGKFIVTLHVRQEDAANFKILMMPISFDFGGKEPTVIMKPIVKPDQEIQVKVPARPRDVRLDDDGTQLAVISQDGKG
ncbi:MAG TPA: M1 family aminopeptidase, partial [Candidatus Polarisedimenticolia bacterium]|nr:M1 family aminopeptidase [Candidatus Polarisedimenticolia bacterium]